MNILFITHYTALYGANRSLVNLLTGLKNYNVKPLVVIPEDGDLCHILEIMEIPFIIQNFNWWCADKNHKSFKRKVNFKNSLIKYFENRRRKENNRLFLEELHEKIIDFSPDFICSNSSVFNFGFLYSRKINKPHIWFLRESQEQYNLSWFYNKNEVNKEFNKSEFVIAVSDFLKKNYQIKNNIKNIKVLYNGVLSQKELVALDIRTNCKKVNKNSVVFGIVGLIHPMKGQLEAIEAFSILHKQYKGTKLLIVGSGNLEPLKAKVKELEIIDAVDFRGYVSDPFKVLLEMDVSLICSRMEGLGRVTLESLAAGLPVIGYDEGGTRDIIINGENGLLYKNGVRELADKMKYLVDNKDELRRLGKNGRADFENHFTSEVYAEKFYELIEKY